MRCTAVGGVHLVRYYVGRNFWGSLPIDHVQHQRGKSLTPSYEDMQAAWDRTMQRLSISRMRSCHRISGLSGWVDMARVAALLHKIR